MAEFVIISGESIETSAVSTGINSISMTFAGADISEMVAKFTDVTDLSISGEDLVPYGIYSNLVFAVAEVDAESNVKITMQIGSNLEQRITALEESQEIQNEAIDGIILEG